ncbi:hypothetical protein HDU67_002373, partial [Dinochytrium kinnereticum]
MINANIKDYYVDPEVDSLMAQDAVRDDWEMSRIRTRASITNDGDDGQTAYDVALDEYGASKPVEKDDHPGDRNDSESLRRLSLGSNPDEIYQSLDIVSKSDDVNMPALTFRSWTIGLFFCIILAA